VAKAKFEIYEKSGWRWQLIDTNGEAVATSEPYASKANAERGARNVRDTAPGAEIGDR
jgi:uncharacterized protein YegP (UPF0339 family)